MFFRLDPLETHCLPCAILYETELCANRVPSYRSDSVPSYRSDSVPAKLGVLLTYALKYGFSLHWFCTELPIAQLYSITISYTGFYRRYASHRIQHIQEHEVSKTKLECTLIWRVCTVHCNHLSKWTNKMHFLYIYLFYDFHIHSTCFERSSRSSSAVLS